MVTLSLSLTLSFGVEKQEKRLRLIVFENGVEKVCRKESSKNIIAFLGGAESSTFKGRLRLHKNHDGFVGIEVKGEIAGVIALRDLMQTLEEVENEPLTV